MRLPFIILLFAGFNIAIGQGKLQFDRLDRVKGMENRTITSIVQDDLGFIWFGTQDGLIRFDGYEIKLFKNNLKNKNSLGDNNIRALAKDKAGNLWIATQGAGVDKYNLRSEQFTHYKHNADDASSLSGNAVWSIFVDSKDRVWAGTWSDGLNVFDLQTNKFTRIEERNYVPVLSIAEDNDGMIWFGSTGINKINPENFQLQNFPDTHDPQILAGIRSVFIDQEGQIWIGSETAGLFQFDATQKKYQRYEAVKSTSIYSIQQDASGALWFVGNEGIAVHSNGEVSLYQYDATDKYSLSSNSVRTVFQDQIGSIWIGTEGSGVNRVLSKKNFQLFRHSGKPGSLSYNLIRSLYEDRHGKVWVGTQGGGLNTFDPATREFKEVRLPSKEISSIYEDRDGKYWIGSWGAGLFQYDEKRGVVKTYRHRSDDQSLPDDRIQVVHRDPAGVLWVGTENGLSQLDETTEQWKHFTKANFGIDLLGSNVQGQAFVNTPDGSIWIGTWFGLNHISPDRKSIAYITADTTAANFLTNDHVISLCYDTKNNAMWVGTFGGGLNRLDLADGKITHFTEEDGLVNNTLFGIKQDRDGNLWLSTNNGLSRFSPVTKIFRNYDMSEGLQGNEFYWGAALQTHEGKMFFGGISGLNFFDPSEIKDNTNKPAVVITNFEIFNKEVPVLPKSMLEQNINFTKEIVVGYNQNVLSFTYSALNYVSTEKNLYTYRLEPFEKEWNSVSDKRNISYTNLNPGEYLLRVKGSNNDGIWNDDGIALKITIIPPFWKTWWFYTLVGALIIAAAYFILRIRLQYIKRDKERIRMTLQAELDKVHGQLDQEKRAVALEQEKNYERNWIDKSMSAISEMLSRSKADVEALCQETVSVVVKRCELAAGAIYLFDSDKEELVKRSNYGFERMRVSIPLGEGQISECFEKRELIKIDNLPESYFKISSGLGSASPTHVLLVPLHYEEYCVGVIELASFHEIPNFHVNFIKELSAQVTTAIQTTQIAQQTSRLLEESKQQMEELKIREEELKQNLEEMQSIQEDNARQRREYEQALALLKKQLENKG